jgi:hypothetical protein
MPRAILNDKGQIEIFDLDESKVTFDEDGKNGVAHLTKDDFAGLNLTRADWDRLNEMDERNEEIEVVMHISSGQTMLTSATISDKTDDERGGEMGISPAGSKTLNFAKRIRPMTGASPILTAHSGGFPPMATPKLRSPTKNYTVRRDNRNRPEPTLADDLLFTKKRMSALMSRREHEKMLSGLRKARRFVFDDAATERVARMCVNSPDLIADHSEFARAPFETTWIECNPYILHEVFRGHMPTTGEDTRIGFLFVGNTVYTGVKNADTPQRRGSAVFLPQVYRLHQPMSFEDEQEACRLMGLSRMMLDSFFWGVSYNHLDPSRRRALRASHTLNWAFDQQRHMTDGVLSNMAQLGGAGDLRVIIALALMLIRPSMLKVIHEQAEERHRTIMGPRTFFTHNVVTIKMRPEAMVRRVCSTARKEYATKRRHEVRGTYCHDRPAKSRTCIHDWREIEPTQWQCVKCGGKRWWRKAHERGDVKRGWVNKHYVVQP